jgi:anti-anti-sigma regulatory factor
MKFYLIVAKGSKQGLPIPIAIDLFLIGSDRMCQLRKEGLGPKHCALITRGKKVFVRDFDSGHATVVNGTTIPSGEEWPLHSGDRIEIGSLEFLVQVREHALSQRDLEEWAASCLDDNHERQHLLDVEDDEFHKHSTASQAANAIIGRLQRQKGLVVGRLRIGIERGFTVVRINDHVMVDESEIALIKKELCDKLGKPNLRILLDLKNVRRMSSAGVLMLADVHRWLIPWGSKMAICRVRAEISGMLSTLGVHHIPKFGDKRMALTAKW